MGKVTSEYKRWVPKAAPSELFPYAYTLKWIKTIDELKEILSQPTDYMGFDTETTGLNQEEIDIVGYSFCLDGKIAYYVPVNHDSYKLGLESVDLIYEKMCNTKTVAMFNMRYDVRVLEYIGYKELFNQIQEKDYTEDFNILVNKYISLGKKCPYSNSDELKEAKKLELSNRAFYKYDMSKINTYDVQAVVYLADTNVKYPSLKASEEWYLGWRGSSFEQTVSNAADERAVTMKKDTKTGEMVIKDMNFYYLTPEEAYEYAAIDALGTYLLGIKCKPFYDEAKTSGWLDVNCLMPLTRFENELTLIDTNRLKQYSDRLSKNIQDCENRCWTTAGKEFNLGSNKETNEVLKSLNIHTGIVTKRGEMSTSKEAIKGCLDKLDKNDPARQFLQDLTNYGTYTKQKSSYIDNIIEMCESNKHHKNRLRFSYKTTEVPSGRLAAGGDKKNQFFANCNIQNITKPHVTNHYSITEEQCKKYYPDVWEALDNSGTREECSTPLYYYDKEKLNKYLIDAGIDIANYKIEGNRWSYRIYGYVFSEQPWIIPEEELVVEGFIQDLNIRSCFLPDDDYYWVSCVDTNSIVEIETGEKVPISFFNNIENRNNHKIKSLNTYHKVEHYFDKGQQNKCILKTKLGKSLNCTKDHRFYVLDEDGELLLKTFSELNIDDYIISIEEDENNE